MAGDFRIALDQDVVRVTSRGKPDYEGTRDMLREVGRVAAQSRCGRLLFDFRAADSSAAYVSTVRHAEEAPQAGIDHSFRIALLGAADNPMLNYFEAVAVKRGFQVRAFVDEDLALDWLHSET